ncbi:MAG: hypothetical protein RBT38_13410 [Bacteroidales bacterium]|jgi:phosphotriesterase-related protein|nr:hypothetical protein [Bacteroidales bacterium]
MEDKNSDFDTLKIILWLILFLCFGIIIITCSPAPPEHIMTVNGPVEISQAGTILEHEHILVDFIGADSTGYHRWNRNEVREKLTPLVAEAGRKGVTTIVECTPAYLGRDPLLLKELSERTGMNFVTNTGYYGVRNNLYLPESFYALDAPRLAAMWTDEFVNGIEDTGIRPGFIKISVDPSEPLSDDHKKLVVAAALTHLETGLTIASHTGPDGPAFEQLSIIRENGVDPSAFIWVHAQGGTTEGNIEAARAGAWISLDNIHTPAEPGDTSHGSPEWYAGRIDELRRNGFLDQVLISHDSGWYDPALPEGGEINGFTAVFDYLIPALKARDFSDREIEQLLVTNPVNAFKIRVRELSRKPDL